jgi:hypothetical protein
MFKLKSNTTLWIVFAVLLIAVVLIFTTESTKKERSFRKELVTIDTSAVTSLSIYPKSKNGQEVKLLLDDNSDTWKVSGENSRTYSVPKSKIDNLFTQLLAIKPKRVAARSKTKWKEYQVDSAATRVVVNEDGAEVLDLIIGKFAFQQPRSMSTFVRLNDENEVYEVDGFLDMTFNKDVNSFRNETIVKSDKNKWEKLSFFYTEGESFELVKMENNWIIDGLATDSAKTVNTFNSLARLTNTNFIDKTPDEILPQQTSKLVIEVEDSEPIEIIGYKNDSKYFIHSSQNPENYFDGKTIGSKIFIDKKSFLKE